MEKLTIGEEITKWLGFKKKQKKLQKSLAQRNKINKKLLKDMENLDK